jgi:hypothetical protein
MKKLFAVLLSASICSHVFAQSGASSQPKFIIDGGVNQVSINNPSFNGWAMSNYGKNENPGVSGFFDLAVTGKWDANLHIAAANPFLVAGIEFGKRLTKPNSPLAMYLNLDWGDFDAMFNDLAPLNYTLTPDQQGQQMQLKSSNTFFGITSRNYFSRLQFYIGKAHRGVFTSGFYVTGGWTPFRKQWRYGYYEDDGTDADGVTTYNFNSVKVYNIPTINNFFIDTGFFVGIGLF